METIGNWIILVIVIVAVWGAIQEIGVGTILKFLAIALGVGAVAVGIYFAYMQLPKNVTVKYRDSKVNIHGDNFTPLKSPKDSGGGVDGAWYDEREKYMIIKLDKTYYHYCGMPQSTWNGLGNSQAPYLYYQLNIKGNYDCRTNPAPNY